MPSLKTQLFQALQEIFLVIFKHFIVTNSDTAATITKRVSALQEALWINLIKYAKDFKEMEPHDPH